MFPAGNRVSSQLASYSRNYPCEQPAVIYILNLILILFLKYKISEIKFMLQVSVRDHMVAVPLSDGGEHGDSRCRMNLL